MATPHSGKNKHKREGRAPPHGPGERVIDSPVPRDKPEERDDAIRREPSIEYKREGSMDVPGLRKKIH